MSQSETANKPLQLQSWILGTVVLVGFGLGAFMFLRPKSAVLVPVTVVQAKKGQLIKTVNGTGSAKAEMSRNVSFKMQGTVNSVFVKVGDSVVAEQVLARLDATSLHRELEAARSSLTAAVADLSRAEVAASESTKDQLRHNRALQIALIGAKATLDDTARTLALQKELLAIGAASQQDVRTAQAAWDDANRKVQTAQNELTYGETRGSNNGQAGITQAQAALEAAQVRVQNLQKSVQDSVLRAPTTGVISAVNITVGNPTSTGQAAVEITDPARLYLEVAFDETRAPDLQVGQPTTVEFDALPHRKMSGIVDRVEPVARSSGMGSSVLVKIRLPEPRGVKPGFTGSATVTTRQMKDVVTIPLETITEEDGTITVWRVNPGGMTPGGKTGKVEPISVTVEERNTRIAAIRDLKAGNLIVTPSPSNLKSGQEVMYSLPENLDVFSSAP